MKILLVNENPVVTKLVTLSAQKTSDTLDVVSSFDAIEEMLYDLVVVDDGVFSEEGFAQLEERVSFSRSLFICSRETEALALFSQVLKKPFLPTDLVEIFANVGVDSGDLTDISEDDAISIPVDIDSLESLDELSFDDLDLDDAVLDEELNLDEEISDMAFEDDLLDDELFEDEEELMGEPVLDTEEAQKVKELLDETSEEDALLDELLFDEPETTQNESFDDDLLGDELLADESLDDDEKLVEDMFDLDEEIANFAADETKESDFDSEIQNAIDELSDEELDMPAEDVMDFSMDDDLMDGDMLAGLGKVSAKDLKMAIGEEVDESADEELGDELDEFDLDSCCEELIQTSQSDEKSEEPEGVKALRNLLEALSDKKVAASMKGMQITINITLGAK